MCIRDSYYRALMASGSALKKQKALLQKEVYHLNAAIDVYKRQAAGSGKEKQGLEQPQIRGMILLLDSAGGRKRLSLIHIYVISGGDCRNRTDFGDGTADFRRVVAYQIEIAD